MTVKNFRVSAGPLLTVGRRPALGQPCYPDLPRQRIVCLSDSSFPTVGVLDVVGQDWLLGHAQDVEGARPALMEHPCRYQQSLPSPRIAVFQLDVTGSYFSALPNKART